MGEKNNGKKCNVTVKLVRYGGGTVIPILQPSIAQNNDEDDITRSHT